MAEVSATNARSVKGLAWQTRLRLVIEQIEAARRDAAPPPRVPDPWEALLLKVQGEFHDSFERVPTHVVFDYLGLRRSARNSGTARRLARVMRHLGWETARWRPFPGTHQRVRGFQRPSQKSRTDVEGPQYV
jgi:hypothetical protein